MPWCVRKGSTGPRQAGHRERRAKAPVMLCAIFAAEPGGPGSRAGGTLTDSAPTSHEDGLVVCLGYDLAAPVAPRRRLAALSSSSIATAMASSSALRSIHLDHHIHRRISQTDH
jgi:hypothetical protein